MTTITVTNTLHNAANQPVVGASCLITLVSVPSFDAANIETTTVASVVTDSAGTWTASLIPNSERTPANTYYVVNEPGGVSHAFIVPASGGPYVLNQILVTAPTSPDASLGVVRYDVAQPLTPAQQAQARTNIAADAAGAATAAQSAAAAAARRTALREDTRYLQGPLVAAPDNPTVTTSASPDGTYNNAYAVGAGPAISAAVLGAVDFGEAQWTIVGSVLRSVPASLPRTWRLWCDGTKLAFRQESLNPNDAFLLFINGAPYSLTPTNFGAGVTYTTIVFPDARPRLIEVVTTAGLHTVWCANPYKIWKPAPKAAPKILFVGDSYTAGVTLDTSSPTTESPRLNGWTTYFTNARAALPNTKLVFVEGFAPPAGFSTFNPTYIAIRQALQTALAAVGVYYIDVATTQPWLYGTGKIGATTGDGNTDVYVGGDGIHPSTVGHRFIRDRLAPRLAAVLADTGPLVNTLI